MVPDPETGPPADAPSVSELERRARRATVLLGVRTAVVQGGTFFGQIALARILDPRDFGVFAVAAFAMVFLQIFGEAGIAPALVQKKEEPTPRELASVLGFQLLASAVVIAVAFAAADVLLLWKDVPPGAPWLLRALSIAFLFQSLRVIPVIRLSRRLLFTRVAISDVIQTATFYGVAIPLALSGARSWSLAAATVAMAFAGAASAFALSPYVPRLGLDRETLRPLLRFGVAYNVKHVFGFINNAVTPVFGGMLLGARALGLLGWSQATAGVPVRLVDLVVQVSFPLISRLRESPADAARALERAVRLAATGAFLFTALFLGIGPAIVEGIYSSKWLPALPALYLYSIAYSFAFLNPIAAAGLDALGRPGIYAKLATVGAVLNWAGAIAGTLLFGFTGFVIGNALPGMVVAILGWVMLRRWMPQASVWRAVRGPILPAVASGALGRFLILPYLDGPLALALGVIAVIGVFAAGMAIVDPSVLRGLKALRGGG